MASITDPKMPEEFFSAMEKSQNKHLKTITDIFDTFVELSQSDRQFMMLALDTSLKKCMGDGQGIKTIQGLKKDLEQQYRYLKEMRHYISDRMSEVQEKEMQKEEIIQKINILKEEHNKRRELIVSQNKANKNRMKILQNARQVYQEHLGLEIRTIFGKTQLIKGEKLQFVFRTLNPSDQDSTCVITMGLTDDGSYEIVCSDPALDNLSALESQLKETNNLPAFLANVRKEFISLGGR